MIYITFDTDHMTDNRMDSFLSTFELIGSCTFFCTQRFDALESTKHARHEIGLHPFLEDSPDWMMTIERLRAQWPISFEINGIRSHSCVFSQRFGVNLFEKGLSYVSHMTPPLGTVIPPFRYPWGIAEVPISYMDNMDLAYQHLIPNYTALDKNFLHKALMSDLPFVFDFHPIHILLNTTSPQAYAEWWKNGCPSDYVCNGFGVRDYFISLTETLKKHSSQSQTVSKLVQSMKEYS